MLPCRTPMLCIVNTDVIVDNRQSLLYTRINMQHTYNYNVLPDASDVRNFYSDMYFRCLPFSMKIVVVHLIALIVIK